MLLLFSHQVVSDSLQPRVLQYMRLPGPSISPGVCSNSCPLSWWCHLTISSSVKAVYFCSQSSPASVFSKKLTLHIRWPMYQSFSIGPSKEYSRLIFFRIDWFDLCCSPRDSQESSPTPQFKSTDSLALSLLHGPLLTSLHDYWKTPWSESWSVLSDFLWLHVLQTAKLILPLNSSGKNSRMGCHLLLQIFLTQGSSLGLLHCRWILYHLSHQGSLNYTDLCQQMMSPLFNTLSRFMIAFLPRIKHLLISWLQSPSQWS